MFLLIFAIFLPTALLNSVAKRDFEDILPIQHIKEVKDGYFAKPDVQLGEQVVETDVTRKKCTPEEATNAAPKFQGGINAEYDVDNDDEQPVKALHVSKETRVFNDTNDYNVTEVIERVELKIIKPLCDD
ncbi:unnamed protein product, partial [Mesorhabditis belari]|uniref:Uncharacterized protein n=1 Tax=Mesorhabditis belari TaxID=2138241 RepID=A0AAF3F5A0_9BILA